MKKKATKKKKTLETDILHKCTIDDNHMIYGSWDINCNRQFFLSSWVSFCAFTVLKAQKMKVSKKIKMKTPGDIVILHKCTKTRDHRLYCSWDMVRGGCNCYFSFWAFFYPFTPLTPAKMKISKKKKQKSWRYHHFKVILH